MAKFLIWCLVPVLWLETVCFRNHNFTSMRGTLQVLQNEPLSSGPQGAYIPITFKNAEPYVAGFVNGQSLPLIVDTGSTEVSVPFIELGIMPTGTESVEQADGSVEKVYTATLDVFCVYTPNQDTYTLQNSACIKNLPVLDSGNGEALLGESFFSQFKAMSIVYSSNPQLLLVRTWGSGN